jgi:hypothetical protein
MQVPVSMSSEWDWKANTQAGRATLDEKFGYVKKWVTTIRSTRQCPAQPGPNDCRRSLRPLTKLEMENMALLEYGDSPAPKDGRFYGLYYVASCDGAPPDYSEAQPVCHGAWDWIITTENQGGLDYVANIRAQ